MQCPACAEEIPEHARFCAFCGTSLRQCTGCGRTYTGEAAFCGSCGAALSAEVDRSRLRTANLAEDGVVDAIAAEDEKWLHRDREGIFGFLYDPRFPERRYYIFAGDITIGAGDKNDIVIDRPAVSWNHALLVCRDGRILLQDSASTNGTYINELPVTRPRVLEHGDLIRFGNVEYRVWVKPQIRKRG